MGIFWLTPAKEEELESKTMGLVEKFYQCADVFLDVLILDLNNEHYKKKTKKQLDSKVQPEKSDSSIK